MKRNGWMSKRDSNRALRKNVYHRHPPHTPSTAIQPQPHPLRTRLPFPTLLVEVFLFLSRKTREKKAKYHPELPSTPIPTLIQFSTSTSSTINIPPTMAQPPSLTQPRPCLASRIPQHPLHTRGLRFSDKRQIPLLGVISQGWNLDEPRAWMAFSWI